MQGKLKLADKILRNEDCQLWKHGLPLPQILKI